MRGRLATRRDRGFRSGPGSVRGASRIGVDRTGGPDGGR
ncbi:MAG: hypothetical protein AVDCRST_MAG64-2640 [uncultured Phycisphaerae bacterium]|uniref:Uncharacterized protein n=1 Tax=uncultured Phycisphaerae bacterium TaxID=904963 RepID=A0A6J4PM56_9BACT|nr:MAG: hypothetical protein AVDCRST_MAG64-2640 [uncultured Phycisphaerae bacterium]